MIFVARHFAVKVIAAIIPIGRKLSSALAAFSGNSAV
jgi:hypothetical protein